MLRAALRHSAAAVRVTGYGAALFAYDREERIDMTSGHPIVLDVATSLSSGSHRIQSTPRTCVPPGSVAVAGPYTAVYPSASPGGWRLIGRTELRVWDPAADPPSPLRPGTRVRFEAA